MIQLRDKNSDPARIAVVSRAIQIKLQEFSRVQGRTPPVFVINDHVEIAREVNADGVHLGQGDMKPEQARMLLGPDKVIGLTAFTAAHMAALDPKTVDYVGTGPFFPTQTDKGKPVLGREGFARIAADSPVPVVGIGGITAATAGQVIEAGAQGVAVMRAISADENPKAAAQALAAAVKHARMAP